MAAYGAYGRIWPHMAAYGRIWRTFEHSVQSTTFYKIFKQLTVELFILFAGSKIARPGYQQYPFNRKQTLYS